MLKIQTGLRLEEDIWAKISYIAKQENRSLNAQIEYAVKQVICQYEEAHGEIELEK